MFDDERNRYGTFGYSYDQPEESYIPSWYRDRTEPISRKPIEERIEEDARDKEKFKQETNKKENNKKEEGENNMMNLNNMVKGLEFGVIYGDQFKLSMNGIAVFTTNGYIAYDSESEELINVDIMNFDCKGMLMKMPVAINDIKKGDIVFHMNKPVIVIKKEKNKLRVISPTDAEEKTIKPVKNIFGFNFYTKIVSLIDLSDLSTSADEENPFGDLLPMLFMFGNNNSTDMNNPLAMMMLMKSLKKNEDEDEEESKGFSMKSLLPILLMQQSNNDKSSNDQQMNPILLASLMGGDLDMETLLPMFLGNGNMDSSMMAMIMMNKNKKRKITVKNKNVTVHGEM